MSHIPPLLILVFSMITLGCLSPVDRLGCCIRENATSDPAGCVLYNTSDFLVYPEFFGSTASCDPDTGCNVSVGGEYHLVPICSDLELVGCISPKCLAMVCGDFTYRPSFSPAIVSVDDMEGAVPPGFQNETTSSQFYRAVCRFLPMDARLRNVMRNSKSSINVFRVGLGGSFDEYDQYRYFLPMNDSSCGPNAPLLPGELRVDRFVNYLNSSYAASSCLDYPGFNETASARPSDFMPSGEYSTVLPELNNLKFAHYARTNYWATYDEDHGGYYKYEDRFSGEGSVYKKLDTDYYKRELTLLYARDFYGTNGSSRAPFECDLMANDCYSASCDIRDYRRGVMVEYPGLAKGGLEVPTDCNLMDDLSGWKKVICAPTTAVTFPEDRRVPDRHPARLSVGMALIEPSDPGFYRLNKARSPSAMDANDTSADITYNGYTYTADSMDQLWFSFSEVTTTVASGTGRMITKVPSETRYDQRSKKDCQHDYGDNDDDDRVICSHLSEPSEDGPYVAGAVFFGKTKERTVNFRGNTIIGYALSEPEDFDDLMLVRNCSINASDPVETSDYIRVDLDGPDDPDWQELMNAFSPYFEERIDRIRNRNLFECNEYANPYDVIVSSIPWVVSYEKGMDTPHLTLGEFFVPEHSYGFNGWKLEYHISSESAQAQRQLNPFSESMYSGLGSGPCELAAGTYHSYPVGHPGFYYPGQQYASDSEESTYAEIDPNFYYAFAYSRHVYLFKYNVTSGRIGKCAVDKNTYLPETKTFGWCRGCTASTLAFQNITAYDRVYLPGEMARIEEPSATARKRLCLSEMIPDSEHWFAFLVSDSVFCFNDTVPDINEYEGTISAVGSPRTVPDATVVKERAAEYMQSGIMPVFDVSHPSIWDMRNPDHENYGRDFHLFYLEFNDSRNYRQHDFERLFSNMGASVAIIDHVTDANDAYNKAGQIAERSEEVRRVCPGCLVAVHVDSPPDPQSMRDSVFGALSDPMSNFNVDLITFDYSVNGSGNVSAFDGIKSMGKASLEARRKPTMLVGFNVRNLTPGDYGALFHKIVLSQDELVKSGVSGIIYMPARDPGGDRGLIELSDGVGYRGERFCAFQDAMNYMSSESPSAVFIRSFAREAVACAKCSSLDKVQGICGPGAYVGEDYLPSCDDGGSCSLPANLTLAEAKCPENNVLSSCRLCNEIPGNYTCTKKFSNGTSQVISGPMSEIDSEAFTDVIAGLRKPGKCCLESGGQKYTFFKKTVRVKVNSPLVIPSSAEEGADCGYNPDPQSMNSLSSFCSLDAPPMADYDIECVIN